MIDIHSHILPGLDDGPQTLDECVAMVRLAAQTGTTDIVATPHASPQFRFDVEAVAAKIAELEAACPPGIRIHRGCDFHLSFENIQEALAHPDRYTINHRSYLLVEFSDLLVAKSMDDIFRRLREAGITPVITHPERNWLLQRDLEHLAAWVASGCCLQVTAQSFLGRFGAEARQAARELMKRNLVQFVASDAHDSQDRTPRLDTAFEHVAARWGRDRAERLFLLNPRAALQGEALDFYFEPPPARRPWYRFW